MSFISATYGIWMALQFSLNWNINADSSNVVWSWQERSIKNWLI